MMKNIQRFGSAMIVPVLLFPFFGIVVGLATLFKNEAIFGSLAAPDHLWYQVWTLIENGGWTIFNQMPLIFLIGLPISLAKKAAARACLAAFVSYVVFNYYVNSILEIWGPALGVDFTAEVGGTSGLTYIAGIKTLDTSIIGAIVISGIVVWLHNRYYEKRLPEAVGIFQGTPYVVMVAFFLMLPLALLTSFFWPMVQDSILSLQGFMKSAGTLGVWIFLFLERILIPTGLHHFIYTPFQYGPAVVQEGITAYWIQNLGTFAQTTEPLKDVFPQAGFLLHGNSKMFAAPGIALAIYATAKPENRKKVGALLLAATLTSVFAGITEPLEFTFLFIAPYLFAIHAVLAATMGATMYALGVVGNMGGGLIEIATTNWVPLFSNHWSMYLIQFAVGLSFTAIYFFLFRFLILRFNIPLPGRDNKSDETKLYTKKDYQAKKAGDTAATTDAQTYKNDYERQADHFLQLLGGKENISEVTNCATRLRVSIHDTDKLKSEAEFKEAGAHGLVVNGTNIQIIVGLSVSQVRDYFEELSGR
ncbi:PTS transporter subunit EIIC [Salipaludibacillus agaradhaerens]|uniref:alpha-glucoside-specific PTS transporter subunit IIBC n=1 Tax=Salipaludibacillus agaradhaerens TaxID=76935 RepID=UPI002151B557|nr:alpha-glucoside-specific PTS transporter subunit IIBC [Salipaludibacillus agaradhaerens]MCR6108396.1 PTS transporter subunit EIIC [Salipaludibacillus agaradhaerens]MCR6120419.1 PTS transporter subunit EIIC [Salipaludibacillus agaradhaerens]